jgi:4-hydroxyphenylpyruvate dioxygenase-like putative hemolysin
MAFRVADARKAHERVLFESIEEYQIRRGVLKASKA